MQRQLFGAAVLVLLAVVCGSFVHEAAAASTVAPGGYEPDPNNPGKFRKCPKGSIKRFRGNSPCTQCDGTTNDGFVEYMPYTGRKGCLNCGIDGEVGDPNENGGFTTCIVAAGYEPKQGKSPRACSPGTFKATRGNRKCSKCPARTYTDMSGQLMCKNCTVPNPARTMCTEDCGMCSSNEMYPSCGNAGCHLYPLADYSGCSSCSARADCGTFKKCSTQADCDASFTNTACVITCCDKNLKTGPLCVPKCGEMAKPVDTTGTRMRASVTTFEPTLTGLFTDTVLPL